MIMDERPGDDEGGSETLPAPGAEYGEGMLEEDELEHSSPSPADPNAAEAAADTSTAVDEAGREDRTR